MKCIWAMVLIPILTFNPQISRAQHVHASKYAGQEEQVIKSLSPEDIAELKRGGGWGLAKAAELNGVPGPIHLLEMKQEIALDKAQVAAITAVYEHMKAQAIQQGEQLIAQEKILENHFQQRTITDERLRSSLEAIAQARKELRYIHLAAHLETLDILSQDQIDKYNQLRGYSTAEDPCTHVPQGHDAAMWRKHNGC
jgi:hypothetical protein